MMRIEKISTTSIGDYHIHVLIASHNYFLKGRILRTQISFIDQFLPENILFDLIYYKGAYQ